MALDPYLDWLQIPVDRRPPTHYELLGLRRFEADGDRARSAAIERLAHVRKYQMGAHSDLAIRLMGEITRAMNCLADPLARQAYDSELRTSSSPAPPSTPPSPQPLQPLPIAASMAEGGAAARIPLPVAEPAPVSEVQPRLPIVIDHRKPSQGRSSRRKGVPTWTWPAVAVVAALVVLIVYVNNRPAPVEIARPESRKTPAPEKPASPIGREPAIPQAAPQSISARPTTANSIGMKFVRVEPGEFLMGQSPDEPSYFATTEAVVESWRPNEQRHLVQLTRPFLMATTEVTRGQWKSVMKTTPWREGPAPEVEHDDYPATFIAWQQAVNFCRALSKSEGRSYRLPTEAEWEYCCRAGTTTVFSFGNDVKQLRSHASYHSEPTGVVAQKPPNPWGFYDMHGSVWEWCQDWSAPYATEKAVDPLGPPQGDRRIIRGGGRGAIGDEDYRSAKRWDWPPEDHGPAVGFRVVADEDAQGLAAESTDVVAPPASTPLAEKLKQKYSITFTRDTLERTVERISNECGIPITIIATDLQWEGLTKNQSLSLDERDKPIAEILLSVLKKCNPDGKLVYVIRQQDGIDTLIVTTRAAAAKRGELNVALPSGVPKN